jgi:hypothetical protein
MKKLAIAALLIMGACGANGAMAQTTYNIKIVGYCDKFSLTLDSFAIYGTHNDCTTTLVDGGQSAKVGKDYLVTNDTIDGEEIFTYYFTEPKDVNGELKGDVYVYEETATGYEEINSAKYKITSEDDAAAPQGGKSILSGHMPAD